jgi:hypothetical protein
MGKTYISGRISGTDNPSPEVVQQRIRRFSEVTVLLPYDADQIVNPVEVGACTPEDPWCGGVHNEEHSWSCYMRFDIAALMRCDRIVMLAGWQESRGARLERYIAEQLGMEVLYWSDSTRTLHEKSLTT